MLKPIETPKEKLESLAKIAAQMRKFNPMMSAKQFSSITDKAHIPGIPLTSAQKAMLPKANKRIIDATDHLAIAELQRVGTLS